MSAINLIEEVLQYSSVFQVGGEKLLTHTTYLTELPCREKKMRRIARNFRRLFFQEHRTQLTTNIAVVGPAGTGKTVTVRHTIEHLQTLAQEQAITIYCDYRNAWVTRKKTTILLSFLRDQFGFYNRGRNDSEALDRLNERILHEDNEPIRLLDLSSH
jgi:Cdc6-like AAA superfamily ATPase